MADTDNEAVAKPNAVAESMVDDLHLSNSLLGGTKAMRKAGGTYLPQEEGESNKAYSVRLKRTVLFNAFKKTISILAGKVFTKPVMFEKEPSEPWDEWFKNIDLQGTGLSVFSFELFKMGLAHGLVHIFVDMPVRDKGTKTLADDKKQNLRPYFVAVRADNLIGWRSVNINGINTLSQIRIREQVSIEDGEFGEKIVDQIKVVEIGLTRIYQKNKDGKYILTGKVKTTLTKIPLVTIYTNQKGFMFANSPLLDLAHLNVDHWQKGSDLSNILHLGQVPILFASGFPDKVSLTIGANTLVQNGDSDAKLEYIEPTGKGIDLGMKAIERIEERMSVIGASMLVNHPGVITATEKKISEFGDDSELASMALNLQGGLNQAFSFMADWMNNKDQPVASVNTEFGVVGNGAITPDILLKMRVAGEISHETFVQLLNEMTGFEIDAAKDKELLDDEGIDDDGEITNEV